MTKQRIREMMRERRNAVPREELNRASEAIFQTLFALREYRAARTVFCYLSFGREVDTLASLPRMLSNKRVCVPVTAQNGLMRAVWLDEPEKQGIVTNRYGIAEPRQGVTAEPGEIDFAVVPGLAFDCNTLHRAGYGRGYYDQFMQGTSMYKAGVAMQFQMTEGLDYNAFDVALDTVITEQKQYLQTEGEK